VNVVGSGSEIVTKSELARRINRTPALITKLVATGALHPPALRSNGSVDYHAAFRQLRARYPHMPRPSHAQRLPEPEPNEPPRRRGRPRDPDGAPTRRLAEEQARLVRVRRERLQLELRKELRQVCDLAIIADLGGELAEMLRQGLLRIVPDLVTAGRAAEDEVAADRAVRHAVVQFQRDLADELARRVTALREGVVEDDDLDVACCSARPPHHRRKLEHVTRWS
jgi:hypothetical protein